MTTRGIPRLQRALVLLNTLVGERHVRAALLGEACELLASSGRALQAVHQAAAELLSALEHEIDAEEFDASVRTLRAALERALLSSAEAYGVESPVGG